MPLRIFLLAAACAGLLAGTPALGQSASASALVDQFSYQLIDLDPGDHITPAISFTDRMYSITMFGYHSGIVDHQQIHGFGNTSVSSAAGTALTTTSPSGSSAHAIMPSPAPYDQVFSAENQWTWDVDITPATGVIFMAAATLDADHHNTDLFAEAQVSMGGAITHADDEVFEESGFRSQRTVNRDRLSYELSGYLHSGQEARRGIFSINTIALVRGVPHAPEPSTWTMLAAGLALIGRRLLGTRS